MEVRRVRAILERVALRIVNAGMYCGWATWEGNMNELRRQQYMLEKLALRLHNSLLSKIWKSWIFSCQTRGKEIARYQIHSVEVMGELIHSKNCGLITSAFAQWNRHGAEAVHLAPTRSKIARRCRQCEISTSFEQWLETMHQNNVVLKVVEKVIIQWRSKALSAGMWGWHQRITDIQRLRLVATKIILRARQASFMQMERHDKRAQENFGSNFQDCWADGGQICCLHHHGINDTARQVTLGTACAIVVRPWTRSISVMSTTWVTHSAVNDILAQISGRMRNATVFRAFSMWQSNTDESSRVQDILSKIALHFENNTIFKAFSAWSESGNADACLPLAGMRVMHKWS